MINKYNANGEQREYKVSNTRTGTAKNGKTYTMFNVADVKKTSDGENVYDNYTIFSWQENISVQNDDKVVFEEIKALEVSEKEYKGKKYLNKTIFADIKVISNSETAKEPEVVGVIQPLDEDVLPF